MDDRLIAFSKHHFSASEATLVHNLQTTAQRFPTQPVIDYFGNKISYSLFEDLVNRTAGWLCNEANLIKGDRVAVLMQNSPQWLIACYAALRADLVVVPISPMNRAGEIGHYLNDSGAKVIFCAKEFTDIVADLAPDTALSHIVSTAYSHYLPEQCDYDLPSWLTEPLIGRDDCANWSDVVSSEPISTPSQATMDDICVMPYTSGSTGKPKACLHTHRSVNHNAMGLAYWHSLQPGDVCLGAPPMYHISGFNHAVTSPVFAGACVTVLPRWDRDLALKLIEECQVTHAAIAPTAVIDLLAAPDLDNHDISSLRRMTSGGASMPDKVWQQLKDKTGIGFIEAYGMSETAATTHINYGDTPRPQCLGVPFFNTSSAIVEVGGTKLLEDDELGEIIVSGPQVFKGYWQQPEETDKAFIEINGQAFLRTGDIGYRSGDYFFMTDRAKRMINASGLNVWPTEIENILYQHPAILEACVIAKSDSYRGETVKALVRLKDDAKGSLTEDELISWSKSRMAAYKYPRIVEFVDDLPKSPAGKILWRELQDQENKND